MDKTVENLMHEIRRGTLVLCVLSQLRQPKYGYFLAQHLEDKGMGIDQGTLYPLLRRLEKQGFLDSDWSVSESRPRRYYVLSKKGREILKEMEKEWHSLVRLMDLLLCDMKSEGE